MVLVGPRRPVWTVTSWELEKLTAQIRTRIAGLACVLGPFAFAAGLTLSENVPADTLFGRWVRDSGYAISLVVLGFAGSWGFPLLGCIVSGDIFAAEDHLGTWSSILTRSINRRAIFTGKVLAVAVYVLVTLALLAASSLAAGLLLVGHQPLVDLGGTVRGTGALTSAVLLAWLSVVPAALAFAALGLLFSVATRNSIVGIVAPTVIGVLLQLLLTVNGLGPIRPLLPNWSFVAWHGLFGTPTFYRPLLEGVLASVGYTAVFCAVAWRLFSRRDVTG